MDPESITVALVTDVFPDGEGADRLALRLEDACEKGASLAILPELPLNRWAPASREASESDGEEPGGLRQRLLAAAARDGGVSVLGGAIVRDPETGRRHNTAVLYGPDGGERFRYRKVHLPDEEGYWEAHHYAPGDALAEPVDVGGFMMGVQICSDANRPQGCHYLSARGAQILAVPRATPPETYARWRVVLRANAVTSAAYLLSVNRPAGGPVGGPTIAVAPDGEVLLETEDPVATVTLERAVLDRARVEYPGYLDVRADLYGEGWRRVGDGGG